MRPIDADALKKEMLETYEYEYPTASGAFDEFASRIVPNIISNAPTIDAEPVVRCKDCRYCDPENKHCDHPMGTLAPFARKEDDFCSYGERKGGDE